jgi:endonuclease/exonuclease/phosphatase family metal-dependent hydrolase
MGNKPSTSTTISTSLPPNTLTPKNTLTLLTYNVWFDSFHFDERMQHIIHETLALNPDICCFQEVLPQFASALHSNAELNEKYVMSSFITSGYGTMTLARRELSPSFEMVEFPSHMGRSLLKTTVMVNNVHVGVGNVHLESLNTEKTRKKQLEICQKSLKKYDVSLLVGDFNFCSERNFHIVPNQPLENDVLQKVLPEYVDVWPMLHDVGLSLDSNTEEKDMGYTFDSNVNKMIPVVERMRYDRVLVRCGKHSISKCRPEEIVLVGVEPLRISSVDGEQVWPSDHFGLSATFQFHEGGIDMPKQAKMDEYEIDIEDAPPIPPQTDFSTVSVVRDRPPISLSDIQVKQSQLETGNDTIVTTRDGSRYVEKIDKESGKVTTELVGNVSKTCIKCGTPLGFQLEVRN